jgi:hypothetical protein
VANGGFGPAYGLIGVVGGAADDRRKNAVELYAEYRTPDPSDPHWAWPAKLLPVCHSTEAWLSAWVGGNDIFERLIAEGA